ncbi:protein of unknown function [Caballeronia sp. S22]
MSCSKSSVFQFIDYLHALPVITGVATIKRYVPTRLKSVRHRTDPSLARLSNKPDHTQKGVPGKKTPARRTKRPRDSPLKRAVARVGTRR